MDAKKDCCSDDKCCERTKCEVFSRIVGYLRPVMQWNPGKVSEFAKRVVYKVSK